MPRRSLLTFSERESLLAFPDMLDGFIQYYTFSEPDIAAIRQRRGDQNRLGFAIQLCYLRFPGIALPTDAVPPVTLLSVVCHQLQINPEVWTQYAKRSETRREHLAELQAWLNITPFAITHFRQFVHQLAELAQQTDRGLVLAEHLVELLRQQHIMIPAIEVIERVCSEALVLGTRHIYMALTTPLTNYQLQSMDELLQIKEGSKGSQLIWLRQPAGPPKPKHILNHIERLKTIEQLNLPDSLAQSVHQNRLLKLAREGGQMTAQHLRDLEATRRYATLTAVILDTQATLIDEIIDLHDRFMSSLFSKAKRNHAERFQQSANEVNDKVRLYSKIGRVLLDAKESGSDVFKAIETIIPWEQFCKSIVDAENLSKPEKYDFLFLLSERFGQLRRYTPSFLDSLEMNSAPSAAELLAGVDVLREMNERQARKVPDDAPTSFIRKRWKNLVHTEDGLDRRFYELSVLSELKNSLRSGDIWVQGSRQFKNFEEYLLPISRYTEQRDQKGLGIPIEIDCDVFLKKRLNQLEQELITVEHLAIADELPDATITDSGRLKISPLTKAVPDEAAALMQQAYSMLPHIKITELLQEVDGWTKFSRHFKHLKSNAEPSDQNLLLTAVLSDAINLGLSKMAESCPGTTYAKLTWLQAWHIRDETYSAALAELTNAQLKHPFSSYWGEGTTSSSDGQNFKVGGRGQFAGQVNLKYGQEPGMQFYTHISDQYSPFHGCNPSSAQISNNF